MAICEEMIQRKFKIYTQNNKENLRTMTQENFQMTTKMKEDQWESNHKRLYLIKEKGPFLHWEPTLLCNNHQANQSNNKMNSLR